MPIGSSLKRLARHLIPGRSKATASAKHNGWSSLPEDIFLLILVDHLDTDTAALKVLSQTCKSYAAFCRPFLYHTVCITDPNSLERFRRALKRDPTIVGMVQTLRIIDTGKQLKLQGRRPGSSPTNGGESLLSILSLDFPALKVLELPRLHGHQEWETLSRRFQDTICTFLQRHALEEVSITTHYPMDLLHHCPALQKLECRIYGPTTRPFNTPLLADQQARRRMTPPIQELIIQDPSDLASTITLHLISPHAGLDLSNLQKLTYYGDKSPSSQLIPLLSFCGSALTSLKIYVGESVSNSVVQPLNLTSLTNLTHLTLSHDRVRYGANSISWIYATLSILVGLGTAPLNSIEMVIRAGEPSWSEMVELTGEWVIMSAMFLLQLRLLLPNPAAIEKLQGMKVFGYLDKGAVQRLFGRPRASLSASQTEGSGDQNDLAARNVEFTEDAIQRWVRVPEDGHVPLY